MTKNRAKLEIGKTANLIADMAIGGATSEELERAVRYSMAVISAADNDSIDSKQYLDECGIEELRDKYAVPARAKNERWGNPTDYEIRKAINVIKGLNNGIRDSEVSTAVKFALSALHRDIALHPGRAQNKLWCPTCGKRVRRLFNPCRCPHCGQLLDFEKVMTKDGLKNFTD